MNNTADALMGIFGFKRVADDEITLDNPPPLDDDSGSLNEGMKMSEVKNEGLEVVATLTVSFDEGDGGSAIEQVETHTLLDEGAHDLCRHSEALAVIAGRDARIAELELLAAAISADCNDMANERNQFRAELAAAKETISRYETTAENYDVLRAELANQLEVKAFWIGRTRALEVELAAIKSAQVAKQDYGPLTCDYCGAETRDPWHGSGSINGTESKHIHACDNCRDLLPVAKQVVMPDADHSEDVRTMVLPDIARFEKHAMKAKDCLSECDVVLLSSIRRLLSASPAPGDSK